MEKEDGGIALNPTQFKKVGSTRFIDLSTLDETDEETYNSIYYKEVPIVTGDMDETLKVQIYKNSTYRCGRKNGHKADKL